MLRGRSLDAAKVVKGLGIQGLCKVYIGAIISGNEIKRSLLISLRKAL